MRRLRPLALALAALVLLAGTTRAATLEALVDLSDQTLTLHADGQALYVWPVSTARAGKFTPLGLFAVQSMKRMHYSTLYDNAPMPHTIFFSGNFAIHGTTQTDRLGTPASAGCIRLDPAAAAILYQMTLDAGPANLLIHIQD